MKYTDSFVYAGALLLALSGCSGVQDEAIQEEGLVTGALSRSNNKGQTHDGHDHGAVASSCGDHEYVEVPGAREAAKKRVSWRKSKSGKGKGHGHGNGHDDQTSTVAVKILGFNDFHGQLTEGRTVSNRPVGGAAVLATYLKTAADPFEGRSLIIHAGDHVGASPPQSALLQDEPAIQFLNVLAAKYPIIGTFGNHEFDEGKDELKRLLNGGNHATGPFLQDPYPGAKFPYVNANVVETATGKTLVSPYVIRELGKGRDKVKVGVIGAVLKETPTIVTPTGVAGLTFRDEATAINEQVRELKRKNVHSIIVTIHQGASQTSYTGATDTNATLGTPISTIVSALDDEVDLVVSGHSHTFSNALVNTTSGHPILVVQAFSASTAYDDIDLEIDTDSGDVVAKSASIVTTYSDVAPGNTRDADVQAIVDQAVARTAPLVNRAVTTISGDITRTQVESGESVLGNLIADSQRAATGTEFAFMNPGGIRADLTYLKDASNASDADGTVLWGELFTIQPFGNTLVTFTLTGQQIYDVLNQQFTVNRFLQISGFEYTWDSSLPAESRVVEVRKDGVAIDKTATYTVTANNFIAAGGDGFTVFTNGANQVGGDVDLDAFIAYVQEQPQPIAPPALGRITRL